MSKAYHIVYFKYLEFNVQVICKKLMENARYENYRTFKSFHTKIKFF